MPDAGHEETDVLLTRIERKVEKVYRKAATETRNKLNEYLKKYKADDEKKREAVKSGDLSEEAYQKWRKDHMIKGKQYQDMLDVLADDYVNADKIAMSIVNEYTPEAYAINRNYAAFEIEKGLQIDTSFTLYDRHTVERLIREKEILLPKPRVDIPKDRRWNRQHIRDQITQGVLQGDSIPNIAKRLQKVAQMDKAAAIRNARTAVTGAENAGRVDGYKRAQEMGIDLQQEWFASLDMKTRHSHRQMDGVRVNVGQKFPNGLRYPGDPEGPPEEVYNCRCTLVAALTGFDFSGMPRRNKLNGMSYEEWKNEKKQEEEIQNPFGYTVNSKKPTPFIDNNGIEHKVMIERKKDMEFPDGSWTGSIKRSGGDVYTLENGTKIIYPADVDISKQDLAPDTIIRSLYDIPENYRNMMQKEIYVLDYRNAQDSYWEKTYGMKGFRSYATGGKEITFYEWTGHDSDYVTYTLCHEGGHGIDSKKERYGISSSKRWEEAAKKDLEETGHDFPSDYARQTVTNGAGYAEDFADSCSDYVRSKIKFTWRFPNRAKLLEEVMQNGELIS